MTFSDENFDGLIVTGAPLGLVEFNDVAYWPQIKQVLEWAKDHVTSTLVCLLGGTGRAEYSLWHSLSKPAPKSFPAYTNTTFFIRMLC